MVGAEGRRILTASASRAGRAGELADALYLGEVGVVVRV